MAGQARDVLRSLRREMKLLSQKCAVKHDSLAREVVQLESTCHLR